MMAQGRSWGQHLRKPVPPAHRGLPKGTASSKQFSWPPRASCPPQPPTPAPAEPGRVHGSGRVPSAPAHLVCGRPACLPRVEAVWSLPRPFPAGCKTQTPGPSPRRTQSGHRDASSERQMWSRVLSTGSGRLAGLRAPSAHQPAVGTVALAATPGSSLRASSSPQLVRTGWGAASPGPQKPWGKRELFLEP